jgi:hypothetical protein
LKQHHRIASGSNATQTTGALWQPLLDLSGSEWPEMTDLESLVILAQASSASLAHRYDAFGELVVRFQNMAFGYAYAILGDSYLAQEAAQEAFITAK